MQNLRRIPYFGALGLLMYMPFHIFLSQWLSTYTGGLELWKVGKDIVIFLLAVFTICLVFWQGKTDHTFNILLIITSVYAVFHVAVWLLNPEIYSRSAIVGLTYNLRLPLLALIGFGVVKLLPKFVLSSVFKVLLVVSTVVTVLGIVQYFLPADILQHVGYSIERGVRPAFFIDDNPDFPRIMSTLREPNALAAYLILPATALALLLCRMRELRVRLMLGGALVLHVVAIGLTSSRSAVLGLLLALGLAMLWQYRQKVLSMLGRYWPLVAATVMVCGIVAFSMRNTYVFQQYVTHQNSGEVAQDLDSNDYHILFARQGLEGIAAQPFGHGPGTAGLASIQNPQGSFLTENYYIQIGYEVGIAGLIVFIMLNAVLYVRIVRRKDMWAAIVLASFWAYVLANMLLHTWSNEAVAAQWWIIAGMVAAGTGAAERSRQDTSKKHGTVASK